MVLIALRATGVSANLRRFAGVGFGSPSARLPMVNTDGNASVLRPSGLDAAISRPVLNPSTLPVFVMVSEAAPRAAESNPPLPTEKTLPNIFPIFISTSSEFSPLCHGERRTRRVIRVRSRTTLCLLPSNKKAPELGSIRSLSIEGLQPQLHPRSLRDLRQLAHLRNLDLVPRQRN